MANNILAIPNPVPVFKTWIRTSCRRLRELVDPEMCQQTSLVIPRLLRDHHNTAALLNRFNGLLDDMEEPVSETGLNELELLLDMLAGTWTRTRFTQAEAYALIRELRNEVVIVEEEEVDDGNRLAAGEQGQTQDEQIGDLGSHVLSFGFRCLVLFFPWLYAS